MDVRDKVNRQLAALGEDVCSDQQWNALCEDEYSGRLVQQAKTTDDDRIKSVCVLKLTLFLRGMLIAEEQKLSARPCRGLGRHTEENRTKMMAAAFTVVFGMDGVVREPDNLWEIVAAELEAAGLSRAKPDSLRRRMNSSYKELLDTHKQLQRICFFEQTISVERKNLRAQEGLLLRLWEYVEARRLRAQTLDGSQPAFPSQPAQNRILERRFGRIAPECPLLPSDCDS